MACFKQVKLQGIEKTESSQEESLKRQRVTGGNIGKISSCGSMRGGRSLSDALKKSDLSQDFLVLFFVVCLLSLFLSLLQDIHTLDSCQLSILNLNILNIWTSQEIYFHTQIRYSGTPPPSPKKLLIIDSKSQKTFQLNVYVYVYVYAYIYLYLL